ncbi:hypothetical protein D0Z07_3858 [Hyphodiscus hymeniophilus]|uniref:Uncharacterized protein n=1 Tax=Hyphodiscus hymeniophilus TaxID=353542 RepID=A0A9P6VM05_9HELO|nr:hypothetical protein D0Z07_3858 [Hyphodiscus hymeniophilus]
MKSSQSVVLAFMLSLPLFVGAQLAGPAPDASTAKPRGALMRELSGKRGLDFGAAASATPSTTITLTPAQPSSTLSTSATSSDSATYSTTINTIEVASFMTSSTQTSSDTVFTSRAVAVATDSSATPTLSPSSSSQSSISHRTLIIVLSSVLGSFGIVLILAAIFLIYRFGQGRSPFGHRSATPLDDDEIESWRGTVMEQKQRPSDVDPTMLNRQGNSIKMQPSPGWTWTASPTSLRSGVSPTTTVPGTPAFVAKAPNSRVGLTDETVPGADAFIPPVKRQSSRLSKAPPGHIRSKSRRSSMSAKSIWSYNGGLGPSPSDKMPIWYDPDDQAIGRALSRADQTMSNSPAASVFDGVAGGLSPRPKSQIRSWDKEIGRAIA